MSASLRRAGVAISSLALLIVSAGLALFWLAAALHAWLSTMMDPALGALIVGLVFLLPLLGLLLVHLIAIRVETKHEATLEAKPVGHDQAPGEVMKSVVDGVQGLFKQRPLLALVLSLGAGAVIARYPGAARALAHYMAHKAR